VWCRPDSTIEYTIPQFTNGKPDYVLRGDGLAFPCTGDGNPVADHVVTVPSNVGAVFPDGYAVYAAPTGVVAYRTK